MRRTLTTILAAAILTGGGTIAFAAGDDSPRREVSIPTRPCPDATASGNSMNCFWDGKGPSFWAIERKDGSVCQRFLDPKINRERGGCWFE